MENYHSGPEWRDINRASTPLHDKASSHSQSLLFVSNELSSIMDSETSQSRSPVLESNRGGLKRRLFQDDAFHPLTIRTPDSKRSADGNRRSSKTPYKMQSDHLLYMETVPEDGLNQPWTACQTEAFYAAIQEFGKDYHAVTRRVAAAVGSQLGPQATTKNIADVRARFQYTVKEATKIVRPTEDTDAFQVYAVINYGVWSQHLTSGKATDRDSSYFRELFYSGAATIRTKRKSVVTKAHLDQTEELRCHIKTPDCLVLRRLHLSGEIINLPLSVLIILRPRTATTFASVRRSGNSPCLSIKLGVAHKLKYLFDFLCQHWKFERKDKTYLNAEPPDLIVRPSAKLPIHFPSVMPDFDVLLNSRQFCWYAYDRWAKRFSVSQQVFKLSSPSKTVAPRSEAQDAGHLYNNKASCFYDAGDSDDEDSEEATVVNVEPTAKMDPKALYREFHDENGNVAWNNTKHGQVTFAELYMIAGNNGALHLEYDWISPDDHRLDFPFEIFNKAEMSAKFRAKFQMLIPKDFAPSPAVKPPMSSPMVSNQVQNSPVSNSSTASMESEIIMTTNDLPPSRPDPGQPPPTYPQLFRSDRIHTFSLLGDSQTRVSNVFIYKAHHTDRSLDMELIQVGDQFYQISQVSSSTSRNNGSSTTPKVLTLNSQSSIHRNQSATKRIRKPQPVKPSPAIARKNAELRPKANS